MRILHVIPSIDPAYGGPVEGLKQFCNIFHLGGHEVEVATLDAPELVRGLSFPAKAYALGPSRGVYGYTPHAVSWLRANCKNYDLVIINCIWQYNTVAAYRALAGSGVPYAVFTHGMLDPYFKRRYPLKHLKKALYWHLILGKILRQANAVFFTCEDEKILARQSFADYKVKEVVMPYGTFGPSCDLVAAKEEFLARFPHLRGKRLALSMGRIHPKKAIDVLIESFAGTLAKDPAWHLVIAGPDEIGLQKELEALAERVGITDRITWTGMLKGTIKWGAFQASEVFALPSHQENFGIVVAEAMSCHLPVILSDKVNIWREIVNGWAGLVGDDTVDGTMACFRRWAQMMPEEIAEVRERSRKCFDTHFNFNVTCLRVLETVEMLARSNPKYTPHPVVVDPKGSTDPGEMKNA